MKAVNYLDATFNLNDVIYWPYTKPNNEIKDIHKNSNHQPSVVRQVPLSIESKVSTLSFTKKIFQEALPPYKKHYKILAIDTRSPINVLKMIATAPT